jgi:acyl-CoA synthetase (NDP forming)
MAEAWVEATTDKRLVFFNNTAGTGVNRDVRAILDRGGIPYLSGMRTALAAIARLIDTATAAPPQIEVPAAPPLPEEETACFDALRQVGILMVATEQVRNPTEAITVATRCGFPVVLKGVVQHLPHETELCLVRLGLRDATEVADAFAALQAILRDHARDNVTGNVVVQAMALEGVELILGATNQSGFGSFVLAGSVACWRRSVRKPVCGRDRSTL